MRLPFLFALLVAALTLCAVWILNTTSADDDLDRENPSVSESEIETDEPRRQRKVEVVQKDSTEATMTEDRAHVLEAGPTEQQDNDPHKTEREDIIAKLRSGRITASEQSHLWRRLGELGIADDVIAALEEELKLEPFNDDLFAMIGNAHITKMRSGDLSSSERRAASKAAMKSFDRALELNPKNWTARFSRAMSNSSAPAFLGLQKAAIDDFETLLKQQSDLPHSEDHAHTYVFLANLQEGSGNTDRAADLREEARSRFPNDLRFR